MNKLQVWAVGGLLSLILSYIGVPWLYRQYLAFTTKQVIEKGEDLSAIRQLEFCALVPIENNDKQIKSCTDFFTKYMPKKSEGFEHGDPFPFNPLAPEQIEDAYELLSNTRKRLKLDPLPSLYFLSHGSLGMPTKNNTHR